MCACSINPSQLPYCYRLPSHYGTVFLEFLFLFIYLFYLFHTSGAPLVLVQEIFLAQVLLRGSIVSGHEGPRKKHKNNQLKLSYHIIKETKK